MNYDFIIVGSGIAGLNAALNASVKGKTLVITKKKLKASNTWYAQGGIAAAISSKDSVEKHIRDTLKAGSFHNNRKTVAFIIKSAPAAIKKLGRLGVKFDSARNIIALNKEGGHSEKRIVHKGDHTGRSIEEALIKAVLSQKNISIEENSLCSKLLVKGGKCFGVQILKKNKFRNIYGNIVILATGGLGQVYAKTTNPEIATGDGIAMASEAHCKIEDLEFIQFHPTALDQKTPPQFLLSETLRGEGAKLLNNKGQRFMLKIHPLAELAARDIISKAIYEEEKFGPVYLDMRIIPKKEFKKKFPQIFKKLSELGIETTNTPVPVTAVAHYSCGGVATNLKGQTSTRNLLAVGEVACTGLHGANRLASNSLLEAFVMSEQITWARTKANKVIPNFPLPSFKKQRSTTQVRKQIQKIMWGEAGIVRTKKGLTEAILELTNLRKKLPPATDTQSIQTKNVLVTALLIAKAALKRKKSLGCHIIS